MPLNHTQNNLCIFTRVTRKETITYTSKSIRLKEDSKDRILHIILRLFCVSEEAMLRLQIHAVRIPLLCPKREYIFRT